MFAHKARNSIAFALAAALALGLGLSSCAHNNPDLAAGYGAAGPGSVQEFNQTVGDRVFFDTDQTDLSPTARPVDRLTLSYRSGDVRVDPPKPNELDALEHELVDRRQAALKVVSANPAQARPSIENCRYCVVRQLCVKFAVNSNSQPFALRSCKSRTVCGMFGSPRIFRPAPPGFPTAWD